MCCWISPFIVAASFFSFILSAYHSISWQFEQLSYDNSHHYVVFSVIFTRRPFSIKKLKIWQCDVLTFSWREDMCTPQTSPHLCLVTAIKICNYLKCHRSKPKNFDCLLGYAVIGLCTISTTDYNYCRHISPNSRLFTCKYLETTCDSEHPITICYWVMITNISLLLTTGVTGHCT